MGAPYTATPQIDANDPPLPDGDVASIATARRMRDARAFARVAAWGALRGPSHLVMDPGGSNSAFTLRLGPIDAVVLADSDGVWRRYGLSAETTYGLSVVEGSPSNLANDTIYYVYLWSDAAAPSAVKVQISTMPPSDLGSPGVARLWKQSSTTNYRYVGWFPTNGSGVPQALRRVNGLTVFATPRLVVQNGPSGGTSNANLSLATAVPPHVHLIRARVAVSTTGTSVIAVNSPGANVSVGGNTDLVELYSDDSGLRYSALVNSGESAVLSLYVQSCQE